MILSVVMPTRDKRPLLARTLDALERQEGLDEPWEIVVVDDASTDGTAELLAERTGRAGNRLRVIRCPENVGRAAARNRGVAAAGGRWVLFLDDDIIAPPGLLAAHLRRLAERPGWGTIGRVVTEPALIDAPHFHYLDTRGVAKVSDAPVPARYFVTQNAAVPREALVTAGGFDERFRAYGLEDMEVGFRLEERSGVRFLPLPSPIPFHAHHHRLADVLAKKRECGAASLPLLAGLHPGRLREMRLHWVVDVGGPGWDAGLAWLVRWGAQRWPAAAVERLIRDWPSDPRRRPVLFGLYARLFDLLILFSYRQGYACGGQRS